MTRGKKVVVVTPVVFRKTRRKGEDQEVFAFFPDADVCFGRILCYSHFGQHSEADYAFCSKGCCKCSEAEYAPLKKELEEQFGYVLKVLRRFPSGAVQKHWH